ncbi:MAG TPA: hypothetical protein P5313_16755 [Spirochaetia bacterium]|nr:hypothetical protein [Spirochaetia bacterium]
MEWKKVREIDLGGFSPETATPLSFLFSVYSVSSVVDSDNSPICMAEGI